MSGQDDERAARAVWSRMSEPGDLFAGALVAELGAREALAWAAAAQAGTVEWTALDGLGPAPTGRARDRLVEHARRWAARRPPDVAAILDEGARAGLRVVVPADPQWPAGLDDLGSARPHCLWVRGRIGPGGGPSSAGAADGGRPPAGAADAGPPPAGAADGQRRAGVVAVVGSRSCTAYGRHVAADLGHDLSHAGALVISGGAYGIDAAAHRGALSAGAPTVVVLAGGADRAYPAGHGELFDDVVAAGGGLASESPPGALPVRSRFLQRNRLIAAMSGATVVVEAAWRSGALSTANHAARLLRPVGVIPGPVTSAASAGCHRLLRDGVGVCVTDAHEVLELVGPLGPGRDDPVVFGALDEVDPLARSVHEAMSVSRPIEPSCLAEGLGVAVASVRGALGRLELAGLAVRSTGGWAALRPPGPTGRAAAQTASRLPRRGVIGVTGENVER